jgi:hypothetical protein
MTARRKDGRKELRKRVGLEANAAIDRAPEDRTASGGRRAAFPEPADGGDQGDHEQGAQDVDVQVLARDGLVHRGLEVSLLLLQGGDHWKIQIKRIFSNAR